MAQFTPDEARAFLNEGQQDSAPTSTNATAIMSLLPATDEALKSASQKFASARQRMMPQNEPDFASKLGARPGVPFDSQTGIPIQTRFLLAQRRTPEEQEALLQNIYGGSTRKNSFGDFVVTIQDKGQPKDLLVNPLGVDMSDIGEIISMAPEIAGAAVGGLLSKGAKFTPGIMQALRTLVGSSAGAEGAGLIEDLAVSDRPVSELGRERLGMAAMDVGMGAGMGLFSKVATKVASPFAKTPELQFDARRAQQFFKDEFGVSIPLTPAESTGSAFLQRSEAMMLQKPGFSGPIRDIIEKRNKQLDEIQKIALGGSVPDEELAGQAALKAIGAKTAPARFEVERAASALRETGSKELQDTLSSLAGAGPVNKTALGSSIRTRALEKRAQFQKESELNYDAVFSDPRTQTKNISGDELSRDAESILKKLPTKENLISEPTGLVDEFGSEIAKNSVKGEVLKEFVPDGVLSKLTALSGLKGKPFRLDELMAMRREVANDIAQGEAIPGVQTRYLNQIQGVLTQRIKTGLNELDPALLAKWEKANTEYAKGAAEFKKAGIAELFREAEQPGFIGDTEIVARATSGKKAQDFYTAYKNFLGENSAEIQQFRRAIADDVLSKSPLSDTVDAAGFVRRIDELSKDAPDVLQEVFGVGGQRARDIATALKGASGNLDEAELLEAVRSKTLTATKLEELLSAQNKRDQLYRNSIIKSVEDGTFKSERIKPTDFVNKMAFKAEPAEVREVMSLINDQPEVVEDIRTLAFKKVLDNATVTSKSGTKVIDSNALGKQLDDPETAKRLQSMLGSDTYEILKQTRNLLAPGAVRDESFSAAGGMSAGSQISGLIEKGEFKYLSQALKNFVVAKAYASPVIRAWFSNTLISPQGSANIVNAAIASAPFVRGVLDSYGEEEGRSVMRQIKSSVDRYASENPASLALPKGQRPSPPESFATPDEARRFLNEPR